MNDNMIALLELRSTFVVHRSLVAMSGLGCFLVACGTAPVIRHESPPEVVGAKPREAQIPEQVLPVVDDALAVDNPIRQERADANAKLLATKDWDSAPKGSVIEVTFTAHFERAKPRKRPRGMSEEEFDSSGLASLPIPVPTTVTLQLFEPAPSRKTYGTPKTFTFEGTSDGPTAYDCSKSAIVNYFSNGIGQTFLFQRVPDGKVVFSTSRASDGMPDPGSAPEAPSASDLYVFRAPEDVHFRERLIVINAEKIAETSCEPRSDE